MNSTDTGQYDADTQAETITVKSTRLHYLDWLQVLAILGVFLFHAVHPFDDLVDWHIKNTEKSVLATFYTGFFNLWGMPFFFLMAGATSWFSLRRRSPGRYVRERVTRLLIPFIVGSIMLTPIQAYYEFIHKGWWEGGSIVEFIFSAEARSYFYTEYNSIGFNPGIFGDLGYHLWFVGFLFTYALIALPLFNWLKSDSGKRLIASFAQLAKWRGGLLMFTIPLILIGYFFQPFLSSYTGWASFSFMLIFFISGYILTADKRFLGAIHRDRWLHLILGIACTLFFFSVAAGVPVWDWLVAPGTLAFYISWTAWGINSWCWAMFMMYIGIRYLDTTNTWLQYGREARYPFFFVHQPVIVLIAFYAVQWEVGLLIKLLVVVTGSFAASLGIYELLVRRINPVRALFGMKPTRQQEFGEARDSSAVFGQQQPARRRRVYREQIEAREERRKRLLEQDARGRTPLFYAAEKGLEEQVREIIFSFGGTGLSPTRLKLIATEDHAGHTAADVAEQHGHKEIAHLLRSEQIRMEYYE